MKDVTNELLISVHMVKEKNLIEEIQYKIKLWHLWSLLPSIKEPRYQSLVEVICIIIQLLQFLGFTFELQFINIWKKDHSFTQISNIIQYFQIFPFFQSNKEMYLIAFYICVIIVLITVIDIIYIAVSFSNNKLSLTWPIQLLRIILGFQIKYDVNNNYN